MKKSFSLIELLIVVVIITLVYGFSVSSFNFSLTPKPQLGLQNLRNTLLTYSFSNEISFKCLEDSKDCMIIADGNVIKTVPSFFDNEDLPRVYNYSIDYNEFSFDEYQISEYETQPVVFDLTLTKGGLKKEMIVEYKEKVYIFNSLFDVPVVVEDITGIDEYFTSRMSEIQDAF